MQKKLFTNKDTWSGGFYELAMEISADDMNQIKDILQAILTFPPLTGYYLDMNIEPEEQIRQDVNEIKIDPNILPHFLGILTLPNGKKSACGVCLITEDQERCWVDFYLPMGALAEVYNVGAYPFGDFETSPKWQEPVDDWLYKLAFHINSYITFRFATIGFENVGIPNKDEIDHDGIPEDRYFGYLVSEIEGLKYYPRNKTFTDNDFQIHEP